MRWRLMRVAGVSAAVVIVLYAVIAAAIDAALFQTLTSDVDQRIKARIGLIIEHPSVITRPIPSGEHNQPLYVWLMGPDGRLVGSTVQAPQVPRNFHPGGPQTVLLDGSRFRVFGETFSDGWLVVGQGVDDIYAAITRLAVVEGIAALPLALATFLGSLLIARRSVAPVEKARRRQLAFTADASHELRTPLTVIEAEASLALQKERSGEAYRETLRRIADEGARLRRIVEDLLWLARFDAEPTAPQTDTVDVGAVATDSVARFQPLAAQRGLRLSGSVSAPAPPLIVAPPEWVDRLAGVLIDNACRYSPEGGAVKVSVVTGDARVRLIVEDSGPGIPVAERAHIFDRFHRASSSPGGAGLGLSIGDSLVRATGGHWEVGETATGGARMAVWWPAARGPREPEPALPLPSREAAAARAPGAPRSPGRAPRRDLRRS